MTIDNAILYCEQLAADYRSKMHHSGYNLVAQNEYKSGADRWSQFVGWLQELKCLRVKELAKIEEPVDDIKFTRNNDTIAVNMQSDYKYIFQFEDGYIYKCNVWLSSEQFEDQFNIHGSVTIRLNSPKQKRMRRATSEERNSVDEYIDEISKEVPGVNFFDLIDPENE